MNSFLIIDDSETDRYILERKLKKSYPGSLIFQCSNGECAFDLFEKKRDELLSGNELVVFLDINMPVMDGFTFLRKFGECYSSAAWFENCHFVMQSSSDNERDREQALSFSYVKDYAVKGKTPVSELTSLVESVLKAS